MIIYNYNPVDGSLLSAGNADPDPLDDGNFLIPAHATSEEPPDFEENEIPVFSSGVWSIAPDFRGTTYWLPDGEEITITEIGALPEGALSEAPPPPPPSRDEVNAERDRRIASKFIFNGTAFDFEPSSKQRVTGAATLAGFKVVTGAAVGDLLWHGGVTPFTWIDASNSHVTMDAHTCFAFGQAAAAHETAHIFAASAIKALDPIPMDYDDDSRWP